MLAELIPVMIGILLAFQINNWSEARRQRQREYENLENIYLSFDSGLQIASLSRLTERAVRGERLWLQFLDGEISYHDSLLNYVYYIGTTSEIIPVLGFYESLKLKGLEMVENVEIKDRLSLLYEQEFPFIRESITHFNDRFGKERDQYFRKYFELSSEPGAVRFEFNNQWNFDFSMYKPGQLKMRPEQIRKDKDFREFVQICLLFHQNLYENAERVRGNLGDLFLRIQAQLQYLETGSPEKQEVVFRLEGHQDKQWVFVLGEFNSWSTPTGRMIRKKGGWERTFELFPGEYEYKFVVDDVGWILDPSNPDSVYVPEVNGYNSLLQVVE